MWCVDGRLKRIPYRMPSGPGEEFDAVSTARATAVLRIVHLREVEFGSSAKAESVSSACVHCVARSLSKCTVNTIC